MRKAGRIAGGRPALTAAVVVGAAALTGCSQGAGGGSTAQLSPAQACLQSLDPAAGLDPCEQAMKADPNNPAVRRRIGLLRLKAGSLAAARQSYQIARSQDPKDAEAEFGYGLTLQTVGEAGGSRIKQQAAQRDPSVVSRFAGYGFDAHDLMLFDTQPVIVGGESPAEDKAQIPKAPRLKQGLSVNVRCLVGLNKKLHDCVTTTSLQPDQAVFGEAAKKILSTIRAAPARDKGAPVADAPIFMTYVFWPQDQG